MKKQRRKKGFMFGSPLVYPTVRVPKEHVKEASELIRVWREKYRVNKLGKKEQILRNITKAQDDDGHWYWVPNRSLAEFRNELNEISGKMYIDYPDEFDAFIEKYDKYRTLGDPDNMPEFFIQKQSK